MGAQNGFLFRELVLFKIFEGALNDLRARI